MASIPIGTKGESHTEVTNEIAITFLGIEGARVLGTPHMIGLMEKTCRDTVLPLLEPTATHCQSGGRAAVMVFGMELMGAKGVSNYYPSWAEWSSDTDTPVAPGKAKQKKEL